MPLLNPDFSVEELSGEAPSSGNACLNPKFTLKSFVFGDNTEYCHAVATAVANLNVGQCNVALFYGSSALGKTHLISAIGSEVLRRHPEKKVLFVTGEQFSNQFIDAVDEGALPEFRAHYRDVDVLLIDDIHFIAGKGDTQEEFYQTFNTLFDRPSQIVCTSDRSPSNILGLEKRLMARLHWGVFAEIHAPRLETRIGILRQKAHEMRLDLDREVFEFIAEKIERVRRLEEALLRLSSDDALLHKCEISVAQVEAPLHDIFMEEDVPSRFNTIGSVQKAVASYFDIPLSDLSHRSRSVTLVRIRRFAIYLSHEMTHATLKEIGQAFGRDETKVMRECRDVSDQLTYCEESRRIVEALKGKLTKTSV